MAGNHMIAQGWQLAFDYVQIRSANPAGAHF
jgi:hypothetical protein